MKRVIIFCEGPTEETFIREILAKSFYAKEIYITATQCNGVSKYSIIKKRLSDLCKNDSGALVTTMLDFYALPEETPGKRDYTSMDIYHNIQMIEEAIRRDIGMDNLLPNLMLHEFEALLFSRPKCFQYCNIPPNSIKELQKISDGAETPEHINNSPNTAPSKRILAIYPQYNKVLDGYNVAREIGLDVMRQECKHFNDWLMKIESKCGRKGDSV